MNCGVIAQNYTIPFWFTLEQTSGDIVVISSGPRYGSNGEPCAVEWWDGTTGEVGAASTIKEISGVGVKEALVRSKAGYISRLELQCDPPGIDSIDISRLSTGVLFLTLNVHNLTEIDISPHSELLVLHISDGPLENLIMGDHLNLTNVFLANNALSTTKVDAIFNKINLDITDGTFNISGGTNGAPSGDSLAARNAMIANGWTITTN